MQIKTITTVAGVNEIDFGNDDSQTTAHFYWFKNLSNSTLYVSAMPDPVAGEDNVAELSAKSAASVETDEGKVYVLGAGKVEIHRTNSKFCPFELPSSGSGGGGPITVDSELSETSENPLQNKATTAAINEVKSDLAKTQENVAENAAALSTKSDINHIHDITASGNPVILTNLQGEVPFSEIVVSGKNLLKYPYADTTKKVNGITFTDNGDGTITANGTATANTTFTLFNNYMYKSGVNYVVSGCPNGDGSAYKLKGNAEGTNADDVGNGKSFLFEKDTDCSICILIYRNATVDNIVFRPQLELGTAPTAYEPPITGRELMVNVSGKNLLQKMTDKTIGGLHYSPNDDGSVSVTGTQTAENYPGITSTSGMLLKAGNYILSGGTKRLQITALDIDANTVIARAKIAPATFSIDADKYIRIYVYSAGAYNGQTFDDVIYPQLEIGDTATEYEPYHGSTTAITPTSNPYTIPDSIRQQDGYNVISVSEGELSVVGVQKNAAIKKIWGNMGMDLLFDGTVTAGTNCITQKIDDYNFLYFYANLSSVSGDTSNVTGSLLIPKTARAISAGQSLVVTTGVIYLSVNIINIESGVITFTVTPNDSGRTIHEFKVFGVK